MRRIQKGKWRRIRQQYKIRQRGVMALPMRPCPGQQSAWDFLVLHRFIGESQIQHLSMGEPPCGLAWDEFLSGYGLRGTELVRGRITCCFYVVFTGKVKQKSAANTIETTTTSLNEKILKECHQLYTDPEKGMSLSMWMGLPKSHYPQNHLCSFPHWTNFYLIYRRKFSMKLLSLSFDWHPGIALCSIEIGMHFSEC